MEDETVKEVTIEWARNIGNNITIDDWDQLWKTNIIFIKAVSFKENV